MAAPHKRDHKILEDLMRVAEGAFGTVAGFRNELQNGCKKQAERFKNTLNMPTNEELDVIKAMQIKILEQQKKMLERLDALEDKKPKK